MNERHEKWVHVEPGTVIPAGQPYREVYKHNKGATYDCVYTDPLESRAGSVVSGPSNYTSEWFIDSTWFPPLELPTEPTWGIAVTRLPDGRTWGEFSKWSLDLDGQCLNRGGRGNPYLAIDVLDFVELTSEQVARIEAPR